MWYGEIEIPTKCINTMVERNNGKRGEVFHSFKVKSKFRHFCVVSYSIFFRGINGMTNFCIKSVELLLLFSIVGTENPRDHRVKSDISLSIYLFIFNSSTFFHLFFAQELMANL